MPEEKIIVESRDAGYVELTPDERKGMTLPALPSNPFIDATGRVITTALAGEGRLGGGVASAAPSPENPEELDALVSNRRIQQVAVTEEAGVTTPVILDGRVSTVPKVVESSSPQPKKDLEDKLRNQPVIVTTKPPTTETS